MVVGLHQHAIHLHVARSHVKLCGQAVEKLANDSFFVHSNHTEVRPGHAHVRDVRRALRQHALVGGSHVRVRAHHGAHAAVQIPAHRHFFAGGLGVHVHQHKVHVRGNFLKLAVRLAERVINLRHEHAALQIQHGVLRATLCRPEVHPAAGIAFGKIRRPQQARLVRQVVQNFFAVPAMISAGQHVDAILQQLVRQPRRDPESRRGVLPVGDHQVDLPLRHDIRQPVAYDQPSRRSHNVSHKQYAHGEALKTDD